MSKELDEIIEKLEKATGPDRLLDYAIEHPREEQPVQAFSRYFPAYCLSYVEFADGFRKKIEYIPRYTASIDAALTLVPDGCLFVLDQNMPSLREGLTYANIRRPGTELTLSYSMANTPALALCIAALRARSQHMAGE